MVTVTETLKRVFGYENFKNDIQKNATLAICKGSKYSMSICISMPPGFGRSLCYQLPILLHKGKVALIFSPKLSYIKQELEYLRVKQIPAALLTKRTCIIEQDRILRDLTSRSPTIALLYATFEVSSKTYFKKLITSLKERKILGYIVFNEAHCLSTLGYDYVPFHTKINISDRTYNYVPRIAVTTSVSNKAIEDICNVLALQEPNVFKMPIQQLSVYYDVWFLDLITHPFDHLKSFIIEILGFLDSSAPKVHKGLAVIYCGEVATAEWLKKKFNESGVSALACHYKLSKGARCSIENKWKAGEIGVIITTFDYGFVYAQSIRCIVYWGIPENIPKFYRNCAQANTSHSRAYCRIYFSIKAYTVQKQLIENHRVMSHTEHVKERLNEYDKMVSYCLTIKCRHALISQYFGKVIPTCNINCDICVSRQTMEIRTHKFIVYSESTEGIRYNVCNINEDLRQKRQLELQSVDDIVKSEIKQDIVKSEIKELLAPCDNISTFKDISNRYEHSNNKLLKSKQKVCPTESRSQSMVHSIDQVIQTSTADTLKSTLEDNSDTMQVNTQAITSPLLSKHNLGRGAIPLEPRSFSERNSNPLAEPTIGILKACNSERTCKIEPKDLGEQDEVKHRISEKDFAGAAPIEAKWSNKKAGKRSAAADTCPEDFRTKRIKLEDENKRSDATEISRHGGNGVDSCVERIKDDANGDASHRHTTVEYLMKKYKLNSSSITLIPRGK